jgi:hypothetical protein
MSELFMEIMKWVLVIIVAIGGLLLIAFMIYGHIKYRDNEDFWR